MVEPFRHFSPRINQIGIWRASQDSIAAREALRLLNHELTRAHIWRDNELIRTFDYVDGLAVVS